MGLSFFNRLCNYNVHNMADDCKDNYNWIYCSVSIVCLIKVICIQLPYLGVMSSRHEYFLN